jgi:hypothetical protein
MKAASWETGEIEKGKCAPPLLKDSRSGEKYPGLKWGEASAWLNRRSNCAVFNKSAAGSVKKKSQLQ